MTRWVLAGVGLAVAAYGVVLLLATGISNVVALVPWLVGGVLVHDALLAPLTLLAAVALTRVVPRSWWSVTAVALVVVGTVTVAAVPVLGRFGERADNTTLLDRPYLVGWAGFVLVVAVVAVAVRLLGARVWHARRAGRESDGARARG